MSISNQPCNDWAIDHRHPYSPSSSLNPGTTDESLGGNCGIHLGAARRARFSKNLAEIMVFIQVGARP